MNKKQFSRRDFLKLAGAGAAVALPTVWGYRVFRSAQGEDPVVSSPYASITHTARPDGSVPILLVVNKDSANPFGMYLGEILRAEGLICFHTADLASLSADLLEGYEVVILAETQLDSAQAEAIESYVARGGRLVGMKPDARLEAVFGLERTGGTLAEGYIKPESSHPAAEGVNSSTLQFHGDADLYRLAGAETVAWLLLDRDTKSENPAVALNRFGDGFASLWAFDLSKSIAFTRQGNPQRAHQDRDGHPFIRAADMFVDWLDLDRIHIPQADEQQRLFVKLIGWLAKTPLPRFWYFPNNAGALLVATTDAHPISGVHAIEDVLTRVERRGGRMSVYYSFTLHDDLYRFAQRGRFLASDLPIVGEMLTARFNTPSPAHVSDWRSRGHEFTLHPHVGSDICGGFGDGGFVSFESLEDGWTTYWRQFTGLGYAPVSPTVRTHCVLWDGWVESARLQASYGIRMNVDYYHVGPAFRKANGEWKYGHFTGSGLPMKFVDEDGRVLEIYQQLTQFADEHFFSFPEIGWVGVNDYAAEEALEIVRDVVDTSLENDFPAAFCANFHADPFAYGGALAQAAGRWMDGSLDYMAEREIPIWSAHEWLAFTEKRNRAKMISMDWSSDTILEVVVEVSGGSNENSKDDLFLMFPSNHGKAGLASVEVDGSDRQLEARSASGIQYDGVSISAGVHSIRAVYSL